VTRKRIPIVRGLNQATAVATSSRLPQILEELEAVLEEEKRVRRHMVGAAA
jgi:hypothetical protein